MAPELRRGDPSIKANELSDMYSVGTVYWELAEQKFPPWDKTEAIINSQTSAAMRALIVQCWDERREKRPTGLKALEVIEAEKKRALKH